MIQKNFSKIFSIAFVISLAAPLKGCNMTDCLHKTNNFVVPLGMCIVADKYIGSSPLSMAALYAATEGFWIWNNKKSDHNTVLDDNTTKRTGHGFTPIIQRAAQAQQYKYILTIVCFAGGVCCEMPLLAYLSSVVLRNLLQEIGL